MPKSSPRRPNAAPCENLANAILVNGESSLRFVELLNSVYSEFRPATPSERALPEKLGVYQWLLLRALTLESAAISLEMNRRADSQREEPVLARAAPPAASTSQYHRTLETLQRIKQSQEQKIVISAPIQPDENKESAPEMEQQ